MNGVIYARFSTDKQSNASIDAQVRACREYAATHDIYISKVYSDEAISGKTAQRADYQRMIKAAQKGEFSVILIHQYDRIARNLAEHVSLEQRLKEWNVELIAVQQDFGHSKESKIIKPILWALSEYYIDNLAVEVKKGMRETALKALHNGGYPPFGYDVVNQQYVINKIEAHYVKRLFDAAINRSGYKDILKEMTDAGIKGKRGKPIKYTQVYEMLRNEKYTGVYLYTQKEEYNRENRRTKENAIRIDGGMPQIIERDKWEKVQEIMKSRKNVGRNRNKYLCGGLVYCGNCGSKMYAGTRTSKGHEYQSYTCAKSCGIGSVSVKEVDDAVKDYLKLYLSDEIMEAFTLAIYEYIKLQDQETKEFNRQIQKQINEKKRQYDSLMNVLSSGNLSTAVIKSTGDRMDELLKEIETLKTAQPPRYFSPDQIYNWLQEIRNNPDDEAIRLFVDKITITKNPTTTISIETKLNEVVGNIGCGGTINIFPTILFNFTKIIY